MVLEERERKGVKRKQGEGRGMYATPMSQWGMNGGGGQRAGGGTCDREVAVGEGGGGGGVCQLENNERRS